MVLKNSLCRVQVFSSERFPQHSQSDILHLKVDFQEARQHHSQFQAATKNNLEMLSLLRVDFSAFFLLREYVYLREDLIKPFLDPDTALSDSPPIYQLEQRNEDISIQLLGRLTTCRLPIFSYKVMWFLIFLIYLFIYTLTFAERITL